MASTSNLHMLLSTLLFLSTILETTPQQECPYPCYPPPTGPGNNPPLPTTPPVSTLPPPLSTSPPAGVFPFTPPSPYFLGAAPPPPEPIVPWFPFYYRKPPHQDHESSSSALELGSRSIFWTVFPLLLLLFCFPLN
ncbi:hypothetical protein Salat_1330400 [Sesamum alatum]|uniref:Hydroxyproline-rich glycoprotein n=1 Tax=Sesamum alatum TaxID=300844 RepID=A0AAE1YHR0_9LAMI|nr:hypothetical protein Salat_1330400 [Sesamum alatum]